jgi:hypothetical protein
MALLVRGCLIQCIFINLTFISGVFSEDTLKMILDSPLVESVSEDGLMIASGLQWAAVLFEMSSLSNSSKDQRSMGSCSHQRQTWWRNWSFVSKISKKYAHCAHRCCKCIELPIRFSSRYTWLWHWYLRGWYVISVYMSWNRTKPTVPNKILAFEPVMCVFPVFLLKKNLLTQTGA